MIRVINARSMDRPFVSRGDYVYVGRPSPFGNPFVIGKHGTREEVLAKYEEWITNNPTLMNKLSTLRGKTLGCWCKPKDCHADILVKLANS